MGFDTPTPLLLNHVNKVEIHMLGSEGGYYIGTIEKDNETWVRVRMDTGATYFIPISSILFIRGIQGK